MNGTSRRGCSVRDEPREFPQRDRSPGSSSLRRFFHSVYQYSANTVDLQDFSGYIRAANLSSQSGGFSMTIITLEKQLLVTRYQSSIFFAVNRLSSSVQRYAGTMIQATINFLAPVTLAAGPNWSENRNRGNRASARYGRGNQLALSCRRH